MASASRSAAASAWPMSRSLAAGPRRLSTAFLYEMTPPAEQDKPPEPLQRSRGLRAKTLALADQRALVITSRMSVSTRTLGPLAGITHRSLMATVLVVERSMATNAEALGLPAMTIGPPASRRTT